MKKIIISSLCLLGMAATGAAVFAQSDVTVPTIQLSIPKLAPASQAAEAALGRQTPKTDFGDKVKVEASSTRNLIQSERQTLNANALQARKNLQTTREALFKDSTSTEAMKTLRTQFQQQAAQEQQVLKADRQAFQQNIESQKTVLQTKREVEKAKLKTDLAKIKDLRKQETVTNLDQRFTDINQKTTAQWTDALNRMDDLLAKISSRSDKAALAGKDVATTTAAITTAKADIAAARTAVVAQTGKTYPITVTTDTALKSAVAQVRDTLNNDLKAVRDLMQAAKKSVSQAAESLSGIPKVDEEATSTQATSTNQ